MVGLGLRCPLETKIFKAKMFQIKKKEKDFWFNEKLLPT